MAITTKEGILKVLSAYNPWWKTGTVNPQLSKTYRRFAFYEAMKRLAEKEIRRSVILTGTRRGDHDQTTQESTGITGDHDSNADS